MNNAPHLCLILLAIACWGAWLILGFINFWCRVPAGNAVVADYLLTAALALSAASVLYPRRPTRGTTN